VHLLERLATPEWLDIGPRFESGELGSRACMQLEWACIPDDVDEATRHAVAAEVPLDAAFGPLVDALRAEGAEVTVVSDGFGFYVHDRVAPFGVEVFTNDVDFGSNSILFPHAGDRCDTCGECGTCKPSVLARATARDRTTVFIGDGISDRHAARVADVLFATKSLASWCADEGIPFTYFDNLGEVAAALELPSRE
jgi:2-hydroxy-3-keto-5-methylthiopentenyl-1-phosphate phosphatase